MTGAELLNSGKSEEALPLLEAELKQRPGDYKILSNLAVCHRNLQDLGPAMDYALAAVNTDGGQHAAGVWNNLGMISEDLGKFHGALKAYELAVTLDIRSQLFALNFAYSLMRFQQFHRAWPLWLSSRLMQTWAPVPGIPIWEPGEDISGKRLVVHCDGGYGDAIMFARWFRPLWLNQVSISAICPLEMARLYALCPWLYRCWPPDRLVTIRDYDYQCALMDLPALLGNTSPEELPAQQPFKVRAKDLAAWKNRLKPHPRPWVGICWHAEENTVQRTHRSVPFLNLMPLLVKPGTWIPLCPGREESRAFDFDPTPELKSWKDTAALVRNLDLVITVDTAVAHLAGTLRRPTWILVPYRSDWKWFVDTEKSPWYPTTRLFRQSDPLLWDGALERVVQTFSEEIEHDLRWADISTHPKQRAAALAREARKRR